MARIGISVMRHFWSLGLLIGVSIVVAGPSQAQLAGAFGSLNGSYCKFKGKDMLRVSTSLPLDYTEAFARQMTLRRLASMARSKGFTVLVVTSKGCGTLVVNGARRSRSCTMVAHMESSMLETASGILSGERLDVKAILEETQADSGAYPTTTGLMNHGNQCIID